MSDVSVKTYNHIHCIKNMLMFNHSIKGQELLNYL